MTATITEFAEKLGVDYATAAGLMKYLRAKNIANEKGTRPNPSGKGKGSILLEVPAEVVIKFGEENAK